MSVNLSGDAIAMICSAESPLPDLKPILQVTDIRLVNTQQQNSSDRYRMLLSDGSHLQQGMLATQMNNLVKSGKLQKGTIVQLTQFVCNEIQGRKIIIVIDLNVILEKCDPVGEPKQFMPAGTATSHPTQVTRPSIPSHSSVEQPGITPATPQLYSSAPVASRFPAAPNVAGGAPLRHPKAEPGALPQSYDTSFSGNASIGRYPSSNEPSVYPRAESKTPPNFYSRQVQPPHQPPPMYMNRGPVAKNEAPPRIIPISALNPYQGRWTIKARVTAKGELRHYNNPRGDGKVFSFDLLDSDGGEIRVTCFNAVADQFYNQIETGKVYLISKGNLKPAQKSFNHLNNDHEIFLESTSTIQPCLEDDTSIPRQQFHFRPISDVEGLENNSIVDVIGVVSSINPSASIMRKNGTETLKRSLYLKDMSGRSVELTLWGNFCNAEGKKLQDMCDSGIFPVLAIKSCRVSDFNGKAVGSISTSQLFIDPDFPEAHRIKEWFNKEGKNIVSIPISRESPTMGKTDARKTVSQIKDERLGTSEKPDWIMVSATVSFIKMENFCYTACPLMIGDRQCSKKVTNNGDGKWRCDRCDQSVDECDYRYILQLQIQDHTGLTWVTAFQECGEEIMGVSAKDLYYLKYEEYDEEKFREIIQKVLFTQYLFKLKVKEETFSDESRIKSTVVKSEKVNFSSESRFLIGLMDKLERENFSSFPQMAANTVPDSGMANISYGSMGTGNPSHSVNYGVSNTNAGENQMGQHGNQYGNFKGAPAGVTGVYLYCNKCNGTGHNPMNCPTVMNSQGRAPIASGGASDRCFKCNQTGHYSRDCPTLGTGPSYGSRGSVNERYGSATRQQDDTSDGGLLGLWF